MPSKLGFIGLFFLWALIVALWALSGHLIKGMTNPGEFGDMFGAVNALFTGLAFATLIYTAWMQREELALQREELAATRAELSGQREQMRLQSNTFAMQLFEGTFFELLRAQGQIVDSIDLKNKVGDATEARDCFKVFYKRLSRHHIAHQFYPPEKDKVLATVRDTYKQFYIEHQAEIGHYFRHLYHIIKFVDESSVPNKRRYTSLVRAQLSSYEHVLLFYNCLSEHGFIKFKPLVEQYALLENMPKSLLLAPSVHTMLFEARAYGEDGIT